MIPFGIFIVTLIIGVPTFIVIGITAFAAIGRLPHSVLIDQMTAALNNFPLIALPLFLLMGNLMTYGGITRSLVSFTNLFLGRIRGGLSLGAIGSATFFSTISGSAAADTSALGAVLIPAMKEDGYHPGYAGALIAAAGTLGSIIPPSILLVLYGVQTGTSIRGLFMAGVVPGITAALGMMGVALWTAFRRNYPKYPSPTAHEAVKATVGAIPVLLLPLIILVGIISGFFTITESAGVAVLYALLLIVAKGRFKFEAIANIFMKSGIETAAVTIVIAASAALAWPLTRSQVPLHAANFILEHLSNPVLILFVVNLLLLFLGMFLAPAAALIIVTPLLTPLGAALDVDPLQLGLMIVFNLNLGLIVPPIGESLFITARIAGTSYVTQVKECLPFVAVNLIVLMLVTYWPPMTTAFPALVGY
ncbi:TRAP transporter large permease [Aerobium aerolatum]|uniref:TRAP transporter large permease protein n=1 Tax=Aquamicrobium aerolatum DSM 21857 TaxID=1121003 RepID=A0A1I3SIT4_9HYPH|nr:TRAP transporter large permease [Aquamicrobium aerolatum]SFJ58628.1 TRAP transporter, DctM subunit [Aquamicrobium aerolatum DSM 21857]